MNTINFKNTKHTNTRALALLALLSAAVPALAQSAQGSGQNRFYRPLPGAAAGQPGVSVHSQGKLSMSKSEDGDTYELTINGDKTTAKVNGKEVPSDRVRRTDDKVEILDKDGDVLTTFNVATHFDAFTAPGGAMRLWAGPNGALAFGGQNASGFGGPVDSAPPPKVMLGVTMVEPSESLAEHLDLEPGTGVLLNSVMDGLPADKAGLKKGDVIVSFDGAKPITVTKAREILAKKSGGDKVQVVVLRKGDEKTVTLELQKFDPSKFRTEERDVAVGGHDAGAEVRKQLEEAMKQGRAYTWSGTPAAGAQGFVFGPGQDKLEVFSSPNSAEMKERMAALDRKLAELDEKMSKLDDQLGRLEKKLDKLNSR